MVDEKTGFKSLSFHHTKDEVIEPICKKLANWKSNGMKVKIIRMDNGSESKKIVKELNSSNGNCTPRLSTLPGIHHSTIIW
jgi:hypothetical protein